MLQIPQIKALDELYTDLEKALPEPTLEKVLAVHFDVIERFKLQLEITECLASKLVNIAGKIGTQ